MSITWKLLAQLLLPLTTAISSCAPTGQNLEQQDQVGRPNPAAVHCSQQGGTYEVRRASDGSETGFCILPDGTEVDAWVFFREKK